MQQRGRKPPTSLADLPAPRMRSGVHPMPQTRSAEEPQGSRPPALPQSFDDQDFQQVSDGEVERIDGQVEALAEQLRAAEERAAYAEQHAIYAGQQAAYAEQQLAMQTANASPRPAYVEPDEPVRSSGFATWAGWCLAVILAGLAAAAYFTIYEPLRAQLATQTKLTELQTSQRREAEAALRAEFDRERETLNEQLNAARAAAPVAAVTDAPAAHEAVEHPAGVDRAAAAKTAKLDHLAAAKAAKLEARAAKHEAMLAKKAERAAKREERTAKHKEHGATAPAAKSGTTDKAAKSGTADKATSDESKPKVKPAADDTGGESSSNDPLEGL
jgi:hypothetical protein